MQRKFTIFRIQKEMDKDKSIYRIGLAEYGKDLNHYTFGLSVTKEEAEFLTLKDTFTLILDKKRMVKKKSQEDNPDLTEVGDKDGGQ